MKGDFSRITYNDQKQYSLVLMQQGRVQLDADWNEQAIIQWRNLQNLAEDLIGEHGGPGDGFKIENSSGNPPDFTIKEGRYYVRGSMCENNKDRFFTEQEDYFPDLEKNKNEKMESEKIYLVYLHLWWRHITSEEDDGIREVALGGPDTATRLKTVWQVKMLDVTGRFSPNAGKMLEATKVFSQNLKKKYDKFITLLGENSVLKRGTGLLQAQAKKLSESDEPCITAPVNRYRGAENQLYRVEIHRSGQACDDKNECATFKWSRENGSVVFPIQKLGENSVTLEHLGRDRRFGLKVGDRVEIVDDIYELMRRTENLLKVTAVDPDTMEVTLSGKPQLGRSLSEKSLPKNPVLRRWDHVSDTDEGVVPVTQGEWLDLEDGVQIKFTKPEENAYYYQSGDWWWIPARTATGDIEWPREDDKPVAREAFDHGDRYAPLALITTDTSGAIVDSNDCRRKITKAAT